MKSNPDSVHLALRTYQQGRAQLLGQLTAALKADERVAAAWLQGSQVRADGDALSDLDIRILVQDVEIQTVSAEYQNFVKRFKESAFVLEAPQNVPGNGAYLMGIYQDPIAPYQINWYWRRFRRHPCRRERGCCSKE